MKRHMVVGVDGSAGGRNALRWAAKEARRQGVELRAIIAWRWDTDQTSETISNAEADEAARILALEVAAVPEAQDANTERYVLEGRPAEVLVKAAHDAELLVLGSHGHSHRLHQVLGSVTEDCVREAPCPVVIIPAHRTA